MSTSLQVANDAQSQVIAMANQPDQEIRTSKFLAILLKIVLTVIGLAIGGIIGLIIGTSTGLIELNFVC